MDGYLATVADDTLPRGRLDAVIAPHAGLMFSGPVGAHAYKAAAANGPFDVLILVGPSHYVAFDGVALYPSGGFDSPLGPALIDEALGQALLAASPLIQPMPAAHRKEHSLEMQLPFVRRLFPGAAIVPLLMGYQTRQTIEGLAEALAKAGAGPASPKPQGEGGPKPPGEGGRALLVASTDLSHYFDAATAEALDRRVRDAVAACDPDGLLRIFEEYPEGERGRFVACGGGPAIAVMLTARARGAQHGRVMKYMHSGQISGDNSGVVGYLAGALGTFSEPRAGGYGGAKPPVK